SAPETPRSIALEGNSDQAAPTIEQLVSRDQSTSEEGSSQVSRVIPPASAEGGIANRKVRTVTVRPDGTIVSSDNAVAGSEALPVDRPAVPALPGAAADAGQNLQIASAGVTPITPPP